MPKMATTTIQLPPIALHTRCSICQLWQKDPALFDAVNEKLCAGVGQTKIAAWLMAKHGIRTNQNSLSRHLNKHLMPHFQDALLIERTAIAIAEHTGGQTNIGLAGVILRLIAARVHEALGSLDMSALKNVSAVDLIKLSTDLAQTIAYADRAASDSALKAEELELKRIRLARTKEELAAAAVDWLRKELAGHPELVTYIKEHLALPVPSKAEGPAAKDGDGPRGPTGPSDAGL